MKKLFVLIAGLAALGAPAAHAADGLLTMTSSHPVAETADRLEAQLLKSGFRLFARIDHGDGAKSVDMPLGDTELLIFGNPKGGTVLMQSQRSIGIDLPLKYLVWRTDDGEVLIGWNDPLWLAQRHGIEDRGKPIAKMSGALQKFARAAARAN